MSLGKLYFLFIHVALVASILMAILCRIELRNITCGGLSQDGVLTKAGKTYEVFYWCYGFFFVLGHAILDAIIFYFIRSRIVVENRGKTTAT